MTDTVEGVSIDAGKLVLSPTRTYAPIVATILKEMRSRICGMVHCSGGAQTKILHFLPDHGISVIKDNLMPIPPLFSLIQSESATEWKEMYQVFNMGHRFELYVDQSDAHRIIEIANSFDVDARIVGRVEEAPKDTPTTLFIRSDKGEFIYRK